MEHTCVLFFVFPKLSLTSNLKKLGQSLHGAEYDLLVTHFIPILWAQNSTCTVVSSWLAMPVLNHTLPIILSRKALSQANTDTNNFMGAVHVKIDLWAEKFEQKVKEVHGYMKRTALRALSAIFANLVLPSFQHAYFKKKCASQCP